MDYGENLSNQILKIQEDWVVNKILEMENLYNAAFNLSKNEFMYSFFMKAIQLSIRDNNNKNKSVDLIEINQEIPINDNQRILIHNFVTTFIKTLQEVNYPEKFIDEIKIAFQTNDREKLLQLSKQVYDFPFENIPEVDKSVYVF